ncbi:MAG: DUF1295 domain-containing protein [Candidatus Lokiarchaeota archaeon]|nr:DUF1295 domain-containing protein [Candidatus Lokiarchaeota archaeon]
MNEDRKYQSQYNLFILAIIFAFTFFYLIYLITSIFNNLLYQYFYDEMYHPIGLSEITYIHIIVGVICFVALILLSIIGILIKKHFLTTSSSFLLFLPTYASFFSRMVLLAGFGAFFIIWYPLNTPVINILDLGITIDLPVMLFDYTISSYSIYGVYSTINLSFFIKFTIITIGLFIFSLGVLNWLYAKKKEIKIANFSIYRYSRHPQYFGFILWIYGYHMLDMQSLYGFQPDFIISGSFPLLISILIIIALSLREDINMRKKYGEQYIRYQETTPFMVRLPKRITLTLKKSLKKLIKKDYPENNKDILIIILFYAGIIMGISIIIQLFNWDEMIRDAIDLF